MLRLQRESKLARPTLDANRAAPRGYTYTVTEGVIPDSDDVVIGGNDNEDIRDNDNDDILDNGNDNHKG